MKDHKIRSNMLLKGLVSITGFISLGWFLFITPTFGSALRTFQSGSHSQVRQFSVVSILVIFVLTLIWITYHWVKSLVHKFQSDSLPPYWDKRGKSSGKIKIQMILVSILGGILLQLALSGQVENELDRLIFQLFQPLLIWGSFVCLFFGVSFLNEHGNLRIEKGSSIRQTLVISLVILSIGLILQLLGVGYSQTDLVNGNFDLTGYPLLGYQVLLACIPAGLLVFLLNILSRRSKLSDQKIKFLLDIALSLVLFFTAFFSWRGYPIQKHVFYDQPRPPNYEIYPNSDANLYDRTALSLITIGEFQTYTYRLDPYVGKRPLLTLYQAGLHSIAGPKYADIIPIQVGVFSVLPVLMYLLTASLYNRPAGLLAGVLIILRENNGLNLSDTVTGVHSQLMMSEIPTMIGMILFLFLLSKAIRNNNNQSIWIIAAGGILGATMLIRPEIFIVLPLITIGILILDRKNRIKWIGQILLLTGSVILVISPWIIRNWSKSGKLYLDVPGNRLNWIMNKLTSVPDNIPDQFSINKVPYGPQVELFDSTEFVTKNFTQSGFEGYLGHNGSIVSVYNPTQISNNPITQIRTIANHFSSQLVESIVYLPSYPMMMDLDYLSKAYIGKVDRYYGGYFYSPKSYVKSLPYWWTDWSGNIPQKSLLMVIGSVVLLSLGVVGAWNKDRIRALLPLLGYVGYISVYALIRRSGGRFLQEMDWVSMVYFSIGLTTVIGKVFLGDIHWNDEPLIVENNDPNDRSIKVPISYKLILLFGLIIGVGALPVIVEYIIPNRYTDDLVELRTADLFNDEILADQGIVSDDLRYFIENGSDRTVLGEAFYPRYFETGEKLVDIRWEVLGKLDQRYSVDRLEFYLIGSDTSWVVLPTLNVPTSLPHGSEVMAVGCLQNGVMDALAVFQFDTLGELEQIYWRDGGIQNKPTCPMPWDDQSD